MREKKYLKWYQKLAYGAGDLASNCSYGLVSSFLLLYLSDTMGMNTGIIGTLMLVSKVLIKQKANWEKLVHGCYMLKLEYRYVYYYCFQCLILEKQRNMHISLYFTQV